MKYLAAGEIAAIHDQIIEAVGSGFGLREPELLQSITLHIATSHPDLADVANWIERHSEKL